jgi:homoserine kinase
VLVHPHMVLATREARAILRKTVDLSDVIWQQANLAGFLSGCYTNDLALIRDRCSTSSSSRSGRC